MQAQKSCGFRLKEHAVGPAIFLGLADVDTLFGVDRVPEESAKTVAGWKEVMCGGPAANAAITYLYRRVGHVGERGR